MELDFLGKKFLVSKRSTAHHQPQHSFEKTSGPKDPAQDAK